MLTAFSADESAPSPNSGFRNVTVLSWKGTFIVPLKRSCCVYCKPQSHGVNSCLLFPQKPQIKWDCSDGTGDQTDFYVFNDIIKYTCGRTSQMLLNRAHITHLKKDWEHFSRFHTQKKKILLLHTHLGWHIYIILVIVIWPHLPSRIHSGRIWENHCEANFKLLLLYKQA